MKGNFDYIEEMKDTRRKVKKIIRERRKIGFKSAEYNILSPWSMRPFKRISYLKDYVW